MEHESELRDNITKVFLILSKSEAEPDRMEYANAKMVEVIGILEGTIPMPEKEKA